MPLPVDTLPTYANVLTHLTDLLDGADIEQPRRSAEWLLMDVTGETRAGLYAHSGRTIDADEVRMLEEMAGRRSRAEPLQYILGYTEFYGLRIAVGPEVLIPRPETEGLVDVLLECAEPDSEPRILDIGTGSGCIALAAAHKLRGAEVTGCDVSRSALSMARRNARTLGLPVTFVEGDVEAPDFAVDMGDAFDIVVSNPPYVTPGEREALDPEVRGHEPPEALFTPDDPLHFYRTIAEKSAQMLRGGGWLVLEVHADHGDAVAGVLREHGYECSELRNDLAGRPRVVRSQYSH